MRRCLPALACLLALLCALSGCRLGDEVVATARRGASSVPGEQGSGRAEDSAATRGTRAARAAEKAAAEAAARAAAAARRTPAGTPGRSAAPTAPPASPPTTGSPTRRPAGAYDVRALQRELTELEYYVGPVDGRRGPATRSALMAFQKVHGLRADAVVGPATRAALRSPRAPVLRGGAADRVEVDLTRQVLYVVRGGVLQRVLPVSSGSGATYTQGSGGTAVALTPVGRFTVERRVRGVREADLGTLYDPQYFYRGWAVHGSDSVPAYPASHGCVRVPRPDATWLLDQIDVGTEVSLYGGAHVFRAGSSAPGTDSPTGDT